MEIKDFAAGFAAGKAQGGGGDEPTGTVQITTNGTHNVKQYAYAAVNVEAPTLPSLVGEEF